MATPSYTQFEVNWLIGLNKVAAYEGEIYEVFTRYRPGYSSAAFEAIPMLEMKPPVRFKIRTEANLAIGAYCIVLEASIGDRPMEGICRYDVHDSLHLNNCRCCGPPPQIQPGEFHQHCYNECTVKR